ncbi:hypothetical protein ACV168_19960, partial [Escherichia coli]
FQKGILALTYQGLFHFIVQQNGCSTHFDLYSGGAFLCLPFGEYLRQTVSSTRGYSSLISSFLLLDIILKKSHKINI